jgi:hypothetical protein
VLGEVVHKTEIFHSLRRVRAPKEIEDLMGGPPTTAISNMRMQGSPTMSHDTPTPPPPGTGALGGSAEYRLFNPNIAEHVYYAPQNINPPPAASQSPQSSEATIDRPKRNSSLGSGGSPGDTMLDIDWVGGFFDRDVWKIVFALVVKSIRPAQFFFLQIRFLLKC